MDEFGRKTFYITYLSGCEIEATDKETAEEIFWEMIKNGQFFDSWTDFTIKEIVEA